jgi:hypothetical protein
VKGTQGIHPREIEVAVALARSFARVQGKSPPQVDAEEQAVRDDLGRRDVNPGGQSLPNPRGRP